MSIKRKKEDDNESIIFKSKLLKLIKEVHLNGVLEECVLEIKNGKGSVMAVDITSNLIIITKQKITSEDVNETLGLGNLEILSKFLSSMDEEKLKLTMTENQMEIKRSKRKLLYLLSRPEMIGTSLPSGKDEEKKDPYQKILKMMEGNVSLTQSFVKGILSYANILSTKDISLEIKNNLLTCVCGAPNEHQIRITLENKTDSDEDFSLKINGEHLTKIFSIIDFDKETPPILRFANEKPIMIDNGKTVWILMPLTDEIKTEE